MARGIFLSFFILLSSVQVWAAKPVTQTSSVASAENVTFKLQRSLLDAEEKLGDLESWQTKLFKEEVVPQSQKFVRDFRQSSSGLRVEIDYESIRNYLRFYGPKVFPGTRKNEKPSIFIIIQPEADCPKCTAAVAPVTKLIKERMERRALIPSWASADFSPEVVPQLIAEGKKQIALLVELKKAMTEDEDTAHADELRFTAKTTLWAKDLEKQVGQLEIFDTGSFEKSVSELLIDLFTELGTQIKKAPTRQVVDSDLPTYSLEVTGIQSFSHYVRIKKRIADFISESNGGFPATVEEQKVGRGRVVFKVITAKSLEQVKSFFSRLSDDMRSPGTGEPVVHLDIHP